MRDGPILITFVADEFTFCCLLSIEDVDDETTKLATFDEDIADAGVNADDD